jgi:hypothetical protein
MTREEVLKSITPYEDYFMTVDDLEILKKVCKVHQTCLIVKDEIKDEGDVKEDEGANLNIQLNENPIENININE